MRILALATTGPSAAVGLWTGAGPVHVRPLEAGAERGRGVMPAVDDLLRAHGLGPADLTGVAVDLGPGSFTGVRVGLATAKSLALSLGIPVVGTWSLDALALACGPAGAPVLALRDARSGEAFFALYRPAHDGPPSALEETPTPERVSRPARGTARDVRAALEERGIAKVLACGEDAERLAVTLPLSGLLAGVRTPVAGPEEVLRLSARRFSAGTTDDPEALAPHYLQPSSPERRLAQGEPPP